MPVGAQLADTETGRDVGSLGLSRIRSENPMLVLRAAHWRNSLARVGLAVPFFAVHDLGLLAVADPLMAPIAARVPANVLRLGADSIAALEAWEATLRELAQSEVIEKARAWRLGDELVAVLLLRILGPVYERYLGPGRRPTAAPLPLDAEVYRDVDPELARLFAAFDRRADVAFVHHLAAERLKLITA